MWILIIFAFGKRGVLHFKKKTKRRSSLISEREKIPQITQIQNDSHFSFPNYLKNISRITQITKQENLQKKNNTTSLLKKHLIARNARRSISFFIPWELQRITFYHHGIHNIALSLRRLQCVYLHRRTY